MKLDLQLKYCDDRQIPLFAPYNGQCWHCKKQIEDVYGEHITHCPHCNTSFCN